MTGSVTFFVTERSRDLRLSPGRSQAPGPYTADPSHHEETRTRTEHGLPRYAEQELWGYLRCGVLAHV
jgi:hypothetical protein